jgi:hypothetical protein
MNTLQDLIDNSAEVFEFKDKYGDVYRRDKCLLKKLNKLLCMRARAVFVRHPDDADGEAAWLPGTAYIVTERRTITRLVIGEFSGSLCAVKMEELP